MCVCVGGGGGRGGGGITAHSQTQYELSSLRSLNTEHQERLFGQARTIAQNCTNHHADQVIPTVILRIQATQEKHETLSSSVQKGDSQVQYLKYLQSGWTIILLITFPIML